MILFKTVAISFHKLIVVQYTYILLQIIIHWMIFT